MQESFPQGGEIKNKNKNKTNHSEQKSSTSSLVISTKPFIPTVTAHQMFYEVLFTRSQKTATCKQQYSLNTGRSGQVLIMESLDSQKNLRKRGPIPHDRWGSGGGNEQWSAELQCTTPVPETHNILNTFSRAHDSYGQGKWPSEIV